MFNSQEERLNAMDKIKKSTSNELIEMLGEMDNFDNVYMSLEIIKQNIDKFNITCEDDTLYGYEEDEHYLYNKMMRTIYGDDNFEDNEIIKLGLETIAEVMTGYLTDRSYDWRNMEYNVISDTLDVKLVAGESDSFGWLTALLETNIQDSNGNYIVIFIA